MVPELEPNPEARPVLRWAFATLGLTSVHHVYGAWRYDTPWRNHAAVLSVAVGAALYAAFTVYRRRPRSASGQVAAWFLAAATMAFPVLLIGMFEGLYNHGAKNVLYFAGAPHALLMRLFPPPKYELPNDVLFEISGVLQIATGVLTGLAVLRFGRDLAGASARHSASAGSTRPS